MFCRYWRVLAEDNLLWREKCREAGLRDCRWHFFLTMWRSATSPTTHLVTQGQQEARQDHHWVCLLSLEVRLHEAAQHRDELEGQPYQESQGRDFFKLLPLAGHLSNRNILVLQVLKGHDDHVITCLQFSGNRIVSGSDDNTLKVGSLSCYESRIVNIWWTSVCFRFGPRWRVNAFAHWLVTQVKKLKDLLNWNMKLFLLP